MEEIIKKYEHTRERYDMIIAHTLNKQDLDLYNENLFTAHSCAIEGNTFSVNDTTALKEHGISLKLHNRSMYEAFEILDHFNAYEYAMQNLDRTLTEEFIKDLHFKVTEHTISYRLNAKPGEYTTSDMAAGDTLFGDHKKNIKLIPVLLEQTQKAIDLKSEHPVIISAKFHKFFIYLHPFRDGNGRLGRLLSNFILAKMKHPLIIIPSEQKNTYIDALKASEKHRDNTPIINYFFEVAIDRMLSEINQKENPHYE